MLSFIETMDQTTEIHDQN